MSTKHNLNKKLKEGKQSTEQQRVFQSQETMTQMKNPQPQRSTTAMQSNQLFTQSQDLSSKKTTNKNPVSQIPPNFQASNNDYTQVDEEEKQSSIHKDDIKGSGFGIAIQHSPTDNPYHFNSKPSMTKKVKDHARPYNPYKTVQSHETVQFPPIKQQNPRGQFNSPYPVNKSQAQHSSQRKNNAQEKEKYQSKQHQSNAYNQTKSNFKLGGSKQVSNLSNESSIMKQSRNQNVIESNSLQFKAFNTQSPETDLRLAVKQVDQAFVQQTSMAMQQPSKQLEIQHQQNQDDTKEVSSLVDIPLVQPQINAFSQQTNALLSGSNLRRRPLFFIDLQTEEEKKQEESFSQISNAIKDAPKLNSKQYDQLMEQLEYLKLRNVENQMTFRPTIIETKPDLTEQ